VSQWQAEHHEDGPETKTYLTPQEKKRISFIKRQLHPTGASIHAYIVFAHADPQRSTNVPSLMDPFEAAQMAVAECDGTTFMDRTIRVDFVGTDTRTTRVNEDLKLTVFVGNLDFTAKEEELRSFFETLGETSSVKVKSDQHNVVKHVRLIRDSSTQLGKGFGYVEFAVSCVSIVGYDLVTIHRTGHMWTRSLPLIQAS